MFFSALRSLSHAASSASRRAASSSSAAAGAAARRAGAGAVGLDAAAHADALTFAARGGGAGAGAGASRAASSSSSSTTAASSSAPAAAAPAAAAPAAPSFAPPRAGGPTTGAVQFSPVQMSDAHARRVGEADAALRAAHDAVAPRGFPEHSQPPGGAPKLDAAAAYRKRLLYRSRQRGWLEVDLLLGGWADAHLARLPDADLPRYERVLNCETLDLYNIVTGKEEPRDAAVAAECADIVASLRAWAADATRHRLQTPEGYASVKGRSTSN